MKKKTINEINALLPKDSYLTALKYGSGTYQGGNKRETVICKCKCGAVIEKTIHAIQSGNTKSCGCRKLEKQIARGDSIEKIKEKMPPDSRFSIIDFAPSIRVNGISKRMINVKCSCGVLKTLPVNIVVSGHSKSCGCLFKEVQLKTVTKYYPHNPAIQRSYKHMMYRCYNKRCKSYKWYGGAGVKVCEEWRNNYQAFLDWSLANGWAKGLQIDKDIIPRKLNIPALIYSPEMCCWATCKENNNSRSSNIVYLYNNEYLNLSQICIIEGVSFDRARYLIKEKDFSLKKALETCKKEKRA